MERAIKKIREREKSNMQEKRSKKRKRNMVKRETGQVKEKRKIVMALLLFGNKNMSFLTSLTGQYLPTLQIYY